MGNNTVSSVEIVAQLFEQHPLSLNMSASELVKNYYQFYKEHHDNNNAVNGKIFEELLAISLITQGIEPIYTQAQMAFVPNVIFDILIYNRHKPIALSAKVSLRERWKQADLEATALKFVHRNAKAYLLSLSEGEIVARRKDVNSYMGLDGFVLASTYELDDLLADIKKTTQIQESGQIDIITNSVVHKEDKLSIDKKYRLF